MMSKLGLEPVMIQRGRDAAAAIADDMDRFISDYTTVALERATVRLLGVDGVGRDDIPTPNLLVDAIRGASGLGGGVVRPIVRAMIHTGRGVQEVAEALGGGGLRLDDVPSVEEAQVRELGDELGRRVVEQIRGRRAERDALLERSAPVASPMLYVIVATGNIYEDAVQARVAARQGADIIAVIRSTGQSLLDFVPYGPTTEGYGGTYATQANFRIMREALDEVGAELGRYIRLCNYCSGLCMPEIAAMGALERLDVMLNDALYGILFRDINPQRTFVDQYFSRMINSLVGVIINTGEDNYLTTADAVEAAHTVLASQLINEQFALRSGLPPAQMGLGHAMEINPDLEDGFLLELAQAQMAREIFPEAPLKYMPPTKHMTGNIFKGHLQDALFNLVGVWTNQGIQLLGMMTEAMHTPHMGDRYLALENARYVMRNARSLGEEVMFVPGGKVQTRAQHVLAQAVELLEMTREQGLFKVLADGVFADVYRAKDRGKGLDGVESRGADYYNPVEASLRAALELPSR
jgi:beta-lysine 5,6-aminomutase alpha subunit